MELGLGRKFVGLSLVVIFSASTVLADSNAAMLHAKGAVVVNGTAGSHSSAVYAGDKIQTNADGNVTISSGGSTLVVPANSSVVYQGDAVEVGAGTVQINTSRNMSAKVGEFTVKPANGSATFQVSKLNGAVTIAAERGNVVVSDGESTTVVKEGTSAQSAIEKPGGLNVAEKAKSSKKTAWILTGLGASGAAGAAVAAGSGAAAIITTGPPESPSRPKR